MRNKYFQRMYFYKYSILYLEAYLDMIVKKQRNWKIIIAISSSVAIACWTKWAGFAYIWGFIVVVAQIASVVLEYLPYEKIKPELFKTIAIKNNIYTEMEHSWDKFEIENSDDAVISSKLYEYDNLWNKSEAEVFKNDSLAQNKKVQDKAEKSAQQYFINMYGVKI